MSVNISLYTFATMRQLPDYPLYSINMKGELYSEVTGKTLKHSPAYTLYTEQEPLFGVRISTTRLIKSVYPEYIIPKRTRQKASTETKAKLKHSKIGDKNPNFKRWYVINGRKFDKISEATKYYNKVEGQKLSERSVQRRCMAKKGFCYHISKNQLHNDITK